MGRTDFVCYYNGLLNNYMTLLLVTILPSLLLIIFFVRSDKFREPTSSIIKIFCYGILIIIPAYIVNTYLGDFFSKLNINEKLIDSFLTAAPVEEGLKFFILYYVVYQMRDFDEPIDGMVYGIVASLGFATLENIYYVYVLKDYFETTSMALAIVRSFTAIPAHALFGAFMGYYFMKYSFISKKNNLFLCFFIPFLLHGFYNYLVASNFLLVLVLLIIFWIIALRMFNRLKKSQIKKKREFEKKI